MIIKEEGIKKTITFNEVLYGQIFSFQGDYYLCVNEDNDGKYNAVELDYGRLNYFRANDEVLLHKDSYLTIKS